MAECGCSASQPIAMPNFLGPRVNVTTEAAQLRHIGAGILTIRVHDDGPQSIHLSCCIYTLTKKCNYTNRLRFISGFWRFMIHL